MASREQTPDNEMHTISAHPSVGLYSLLMAVVLTVVSFQPAQSADAFTALKAIEGAFHARQDLAMELQNYIQQEKERLNDLVRLADKFEHQETLSSSIEQRLSSPVGAYLTVKSLFNEGRQIDSLTSLGATRAKDFMNTSRLGSGWLPKHEDLEGAAAALMRIQDTYRISASQLIDGFRVHYFGQSPTSKSLSADDCFEIGKAAYNAGNHYHAITWMQEAVDRLPMSAPNSTRMEILDYLAYALYMQGNIKRALRATEEILNLTPQNERHLANKAYYVSTLGDSESTSPTLPELALQRNLYGHQLVEEFQYYEELCRADASQTVDTSRLHCRYSTGGNNPLLMYGPAKVEELHLEPRVVFFHQVLNSYEIELIKNLSTPLLHRSGVFSTEEEATSYADYRTSQSAWIDDRDHSEIGKIARRMSAIAGLSVHSAEALQVLNYGIGGHYEPHVDFSDSHHMDAFLPGFGNRISTFLNYLSDVPSGGSTVFPRLGIAVRPEKGGALFWYNLLRNGSGDERTLHAACPVLSGYKWVANKWFHEANNEFRRPCMLDEFM